MVLRPKLPNQLSVASGDTIGETVEICQDYYRFFIYKRHFVKLNHGQL